MHIDLKQWLDSWIQVLGEVNKRMISSPAACPFKGVRGEKVGRASERAMEIEMGDADPKNLISLGRYIVPAGFLDNQEEEVEVFKSKERSSGLNPMLEWLTRCDRDQFRRLARSLAHSTLDSTCGFSRGAKLFDVYALLVSEGDGRWKQEKNLYSTCSGVANNQCYAFPWFLHLFLFFAKHLSAFYWQDSIIMSLCEITWPLI